MGAGKKVAIGCGGLLVLMVLALFLGFQWVKKNFGITMDPAEVFALANEAAPVQIPDGFEPLFGMYTGEGRKDPMSILMAHESRTRETTLILYQRTGSYTEEEMFAEILNGESGMQMDVGVESIGEDEYFPVTYLGEKYQGLLREGLDEEQQVQRVLLTVIPQGETTLLILFAGDPEIIRRKLLQEILDSGLKADAMMPTPLTNEGRTSETDQ